MSRLRPLALALLLGTPPTSGPRAETSGSFERPAQVVLPTPSEAPESMDGAGAPQAVSTDHAEPAAAEAGATETGATETGATAVPPPAPAAAQAPPNPFEGEAGRRVKRRAPPLDAPNPLPSELALMRRARLGDSGMLEVTTPEGVRALTV
ncbi:MAG TPA: hypothetical protein VK013_01155, partial [Myxococcaceae bacterium]|nr:hypothetical protein [Myxococcaceae bacterium]